MGVAPFDVAGPGLLFVGLGVIILFGVLILLIVLASFLVIRGIKKRRAKKGHS